MLQNPFLLRLPYFSYQFEQKSAKMDLRNKYLGYQFLVITWTDSMNNLFWILLIRYLSSGLDRNIIVFECGFHLYAVVDWLISETVELVLRMLLRYLPVIVWTVDEQPVFKWFLVVFRGEDRLTVVDMVWSQIDVHLLLTQYSTHIMTEWKLL